MSKKLLSICIPTYNGADRLKISLLAILKQVENYQDKIEVIVSDNASTDNTQVFLSEFKKKYPFLKIFRNKKNLGFNLNIFKLSDNYANGKYFWLIGDDDVIDFDAVDLIKSILENNKSISFLGLNFRIMPLKDILEFKKTGVDNNVESMKMSNLINNQCRTENLLATFMSCNIILLDRFKNYNKTIFSSNSWDNYKSLFPHTHVVASTIKSDDDVFYISNPLISVIHHEKEWDDKMALINVYYIIDVYKYYIESGFKKKDLEKAKKIIIRSGLGVFIRTNVQFKYKFIFLKFIFWELYFYELIFKNIYKKFKS
jgi:glycosyltransferase involved in cell wall biosynthesis